MAPFACQAERVAADIPEAFHEARRVEEHIGDSARSELLVHLLRALGRKQTSDRGATESWYGAARRHEVRRSVLRRRASMKAPDSASLTRRVMTWPCKSPQQACQCRTPCV